MSYSLNFKLLRGVLCRRLVWGSIIGAIKRGTGSLDYSSYVTFCSHLSFFGCGLHRASTVGLRTPPPPPYLPAPNARPSECAVYCSVLVVVNVVEENIIVGASMDSLVVDVVEVNVIMGAGMHSLVSCFAVNNSNLAVVEVFIRML